MRLRRKAKLAKSLTDEERGIFMMYQSQGAGISSTLRAKNAGIRIHSSSVTFERSRYEY